MNTLDRLKYYRSRRDNILNGNYNCLPLCFDRFRNYIPGTEKSKYIIVTANQKIGKTKFVDYVYVYQNILFVLKHPEVKLKIIYFTLEESINVKKDEFLSFLLYHLDKIRISPSDLTSVDASRPLDSNIISLLESDRYKEIINVFDNIVEFKDDIRNPTGINKYLKDYALSHGHLNYTEDYYTDSDGIKRYLIDKDSPYTQDDESEYRIIILDNYSNLTQESGMNKMDTINKMSKYFVSLRNQFGYTIVAVQHQAQSQEGIDNFKLNKIKPSTDGLADCKTTSRDANMLIGLYSPFKYGISTFENYDIKKFRNFIRFAEVLEDRDYGAAGNICPLFFDGTVSVFKELPKHNDPNINNVYSYIDSINAAKESKPINKLFLLFSYGKRNSSVR